jgi:ferritin-like metal-binding protein YciE
VRLEKVFAAIDEKPMGKTCDAIVGITDEGAEVMRLDRLALAVLSLPDM